MRRGTEARIHPARKSMKSFARKAAFVAAFLEGRGYTVK